MNGKRKAFYNLETKDSIQIAIWGQDDVTVIELIGMVDSINRHYCTREISRWISTVTRPTLLNLTHLTNPDSLMVALVVNMQNTLQSHHQPMVVVAPPNVVDAFTLCGLTTEFVFANTFEEGIAHLAHE